MPRGGFRVGSGRKKLSDADRALGGNAGHRAGKVLPHPSAVAAEPAPIEEFDAPDDLTFEERRAWLELAPYAFQNRTLTKAKSLAFRTLCRTVTLVREFEQSIGGRVRGGTDHHRWIRLMETELRSFNLLPDGKPSEGAAVAKADPLSRFMKAT